MQVELIKKNDAERFFPNTAIFRKAIYVDKANCQCMSVVFEKALDTGLLPYLRLVNFEAVKIAQGP